MAARMAALMRMGASLCTLLGWGGAAAARQDAPPQEATPIVAQETRDSEAWADLDRALWLHEAYVEAWFDPATWAAMDALLLDPVPLRPGAVLRLAALPWLSPSHLQALRRASPVRSRQDLARLPGWNEDLVRRTLPFLRFEPARDSWTVQGRSRWTAVRRETRWDASGSGWSGTLRVRPDGRSGRSGFLALQRSWLRAVAGDLRLGVSQGLLWWSSESDVRVSSSAWRRTRGLVGTEVGHAPRAVRGAGVEFELGRLHLQSVRGRTGPFSLSGVVGDVELPLHMRTRFAWLRLQEQNACSFSLSWEDADGEMEVEIVPRRTGSAAALAVERRLGSLRLAMRLQQTAPSRGPSMAAAGITTRSRSSRDALLQTSGRQGALRFDWDFHHRSRRDSLGLREERFEQSGRVSWSGKGKSLEVRLRQRDDWEHPLGLEGPEASRRQRRRGVVLRFLRAVDVQSSIGLDYRLEEGRDETRAATGSAWQIHFQHRRHRIRGHVALTSFVAPSGMAAPMVADPGIGTAPTSQRLVGDGLRLAAALRVAAERFEAALRGARAYAADGARSLEWEWSLRVQFH